MTLQRRDILVLKHRNLYLDRDIFKAYWEDYRAIKPQKMGFESNLHSGFCAEFKIVEELAKKYSSIG